jgi:AraC-type DNA-binding domain-containing proteins
MQLNFINTITIISIFQAMFLSISFFFKHKDTACIQNKIFAAIMLIFSFQILVSLSVNYWSYVYFWGYHKYFYTLYQADYLIGPLLYFYIKSVTDNNYSIQTKDWLHFIPFIVIIILVSVLQWYFNIFVDSNYIRLGIIIYSFIYFTISYRYLKNHGKKLSSFFNLKNANDFIQFLLICYIFLWVVNVQIFAIVKYVTFAKWCAYVSSLYALSVFVVINVLAILAFRKPDIFSLKQKYKRSNLKPGVKDNYYDAIINFIKTEKNYLEPDLTLSKLSEEISIPIKCISQVINEKQNQNFNDFINVFRIEESKKYLSDRTFDHLTIQEIFYKSGFNSKSTFNLVFKKHTGFTPLEFRKGNHS